MLPLDDAGSRGLDRPVAFGGDGALAVDGLTQSVDDTADQVLAHGHGDDPAGALDGVTLLDAVVGTQDNDGHGVFFQVLGHTVGAVGEFQQLTGHALVQAGGLGDAVADEDDHAGLALFHFAFVVLDLTTDDFRDFFGS